MLTPDSKEDSNYLTTFTESSITLAPPVIPTLKPSASTSSLAPFHPSASNPLRISGPHFLDVEDRAILLRGVNLCGGTKNPIGKTSHSSPAEFFDTESDTWIGRPFALEEADEHLGRLRHWGFNFLRFLVPWEAIEHRGPGIYDYEYFEYLIKILKKCKEYGFRVFIDPHQDVWSRFSGGSGAPLWTFHLAGLDPYNFATTGAAIVQNTYHDPGNYPKMIWPSNYYKLAPATMFTLFFAGKIFAPHCVINGVNIQEYLQRSYINCYIELAKRIQQEIGLEDDVVLGYDTLNEPSNGWVGITDLTAFPEAQELKKGATPNPFQSMLLGQGIAQNVETWSATYFGPIRTGSEVIDPEGAVAWLSADERDALDELHGWKRSDDYPAAGRCIWAAHGVWDIQTQKLLDPAYFSHDSNTKEEISWEYDCFLPFARRYTRAIRSVHKTAIIFLEPSVNEHPPGIPPEIHDAGEVLQSRMVYAPHWYDGLTLLNKRWNWWNIDYLGVKRGAYPNYVAAIKVGEKAIRECFREQLARIKEEGAAAFGPHPTLIAEIGIPYDLNDGASYKPGGNYSQQLKAMEANMYALESNLLNFTLWNYSTDNSHRWGENWNGEDLSIYSPDDTIFSTNASNGCALSRAESTSISQHNSHNLVRRATPCDDSDLTSKYVPPNRHPEMSPSTFTLVPQDTLKKTPIHPLYNLPDFNRGGRAVAAFCRPYPVATPGIPENMSFTREDDPPVFRFVFNSKFNQVSKVDPVPAEIYLPLLHFPEESDDGDSAGTEVWVSDGRWVREGQTLKWWINSDVQLHEIVVTGRKFETQESGGGIGDCCNSIWRGCSIM